MEHAYVNGVDLEYDMTGSGEPVLLISPVVTDGFLPLVSERALAASYRLLTYHKRRCAPRPPRCASRTHRRPLERRRGGAPACDRTPRDRSHARPAGTVAAVGAQCGGLPPEGWARLRRLRRRPA